MDKFEQLGWWTQFAIGVLVAAYLLIPVWIWGRNRKRRKSLEEIERRLRESNR
jgi:Flp pilus assembly protein TadB